MAAVANVTVTEFAPTAAACRRESTRLRWNPMCRPPRPTEQPCQFRYIPVFERQGRRLPR
jgi:hypothetical protein